MDKLETKQPSCGCEKHLKSVKVVGEGILSASQCEICQTVYVILDKRFTPRIAHAADNRQVKPL